MIPGPRPGEASKSDNSAQNRRGHHKIFLGMAAGVGKTYRMLQEGRAEADAGRDIAIGLFEPHGRTETNAQAEGLEVIPRRRVSYRDTELNELDLPAVLRRAPQRCLIDEIAHTNCPGLEHAKRYEDVADILDASIDVFSTLNVQHLESLNDEVIELTGVRVRETIPDEILGQADEVVLIDLTPEALIGRLREGKVYPAERIQPALSNFFRIENLAALREVALRQVFEGVESKRLSLSQPPSRPGDERLLTTAAPQAVGERLLLLATLQPSSQRLVRRAWRSAKRLGGELDLLVVRRPGRTPTTGEKTQLQALQHLAHTLGANLLVEEDNHVASTAVRIACERGTTYLLMGAPAPRTGLSKFEESLLSQLLRRLPGVDIRIITDPANRSEEGL